MITLIELPLCFPGNELFAKNLQQRHHVKLSFDFRFHLNGNTTGLCPDFNVWETLSRLPTTTKHIQYKILQ